MKKIFLAFIVLIGFFAQAQDPQEFFAPIKLNVIPSASTPDSVTVFQNGILSTIARTTFDQAISLSNDTLYLSDGGFVKLGDLLGGSGTWGGITGTLSAQTDLQAALDAKEDNLVSGTTIKTINSLDITGAGNLVIATGGDLLSTNNLSDVTNAATSLGNLGGLPLAGGTMTGTLTAPTIVKTGATADDILLGDGTTTSLGAIGSGSGDLLAANNLSDVDNAITSRTNLGVAIGSDVQAYSATMDIDATNDVTTEANSAVQDLNFWMGTIAQWNTAGNPTPEFLVLTDSVPAPPTGLGDMNKIVYDVNDNAQVDDSEKLENNNGAFYLDRTNHTGTQLSTTISDFSAAVAGTASVTANTAKTSNATHTGEVTGATALTIASGVVDSDNITNATIVDADIASATITGAKIAGLTINEGNIATDAITATKIAANAVGSSELQSTAVTPGAYTNADITIDSDGRITLAASGGAGGTLDLVPTDASTNGVESNGVYDALVGINSYVVDGTFNGSKIVAASLNGATKITAGTITGDRMVTGTIGQTQIATNGVAAAEIAANAITQVKMADNSVGQNEIIDANVTVAKLLWNATLIPSLDVNYDLGSSSFSFLRTYSRELWGTAFYSTSTLEDWLINAKTNGEFAFQVNTIGSPGIYFQYYTLNKTGTPANADDLITKEFADANYASGGATQTQGNTTVTVNLGDASGFSSAGTATLYWTKIDNIVTFDINVASSGLAFSDPEGDTITITGMPHTLRTGVASSVLNIRHSTLLDSRFYLEAIYTGTTITVLGQNNGAGSRTTTGTMTISGTIQVN